MRRLSLILLAATFLLSAPTDPADNIATLVAGTPPGGVLHLPGGRVFQLTSPLVITRPITIEGYGARIIAADGVRMAGALVRSVGVSNVQLSDLIVDANAARAGADYGIWIIGGDGHVIRKVTVRNSSQACLYLEDASGTIEDSRLDRCGRDLTLAQGVAANNHAIMVAALTRAVSRVTICGNTVNHAWRKGITTYARGAGSLRDISVANNWVADCGLGGIYIANAPGAEPQRDVAITGNIADGSYVNIQVDDVSGLTMVDNRASRSRDRDGGPGGAGLVLVNVNGATITDMVVEDSGGSGVLVRDSTGVRLVAPVVRDPNSGNNAFAPGLHLSNTRNSRVEDVTVVDGRSKPLATHGVVENDGSRGNSVTIRRMEGIARRVLAITSHLRHH